MSSTQQIYYQWLSTCSYRYAAFWSWEIFEGDVVRSRTVVQSDQQLSQTARLQGTLLNSKLRRAFGGKWLLLQLLIMYHTWS